MKKTINDCWKGLMNLANEDVKRHGKKILVLKDEQHGTYAIDILTTGKGAITFAENYHESELAQVVNDAWEYISRCAYFDNSHSNYFCYRKVYGWTHDLPALILAFTEFTLYFRDDTTGCIEIVEDIDRYENRIGCFCILNENYDAALRQIEDHDERHVEH